MTTSRLRRAGEGEGRRTARRRRPTRGGAFGAHPIDVEGEDARRPAPRHEDAERVGVRLDGGGGRRSRDVVRFDVHVVLGRDEHGDGRGEQSARRREGQHAVGPGHGVVAFAREAVHRRPKEHRARGGGRQRKGEEGAPTVGRARVSSSTRRKRPSLPSLPSPPLPSPPSPPLPSPAGAGRPAGGRGRSEASAWGEGGEAEGEGGGGEAERGRPKGTLSVLSAGWTRAPCGRCWCSRPRRRAPRPRRGRPSELRPRDPAPRGTDDYDQVFLSLAQEWQAYVAHIARKRVSQQV